ncbi:hypothetical protein [Desertibaculum subflavum]|uniref:hypothetical protein n=1 Tax=Desertibaculum subflavum TaxID=2268458 RepID=UPI000E666993
MANERTLSQRWQEYRPTKAAAVWFGAGCAALTMIVGFSWGGWVTGGTASGLAYNAGATARAELTAAACISRFMGAADAGIQLAKLKETGIWQRNDFVEKGGWVTLPGTEGPVSGAAEACARQLVEMSAPPAKAAAGKTTLQ